MSTKCLIQEDGCKGQEDGGKGHVFVEGYLRKLKTMKKKFFVLRGESPEASARLEYYDSEKKYRIGQQPKRSIGLKVCFNINRKKDTKHKHVIALYTKDEVFCVVFDSDKEQQKWLRLLLHLQSGAEDVVDGPLKPIYEHVWKVKVQDKGLGDSKNLVGPYYVCLSDQKISLVKIASDKQELEFPLTQIRSCGNTESFFYIEVGRQCMTGAGELWMLTGDPNISKNMNDVILSAFTLRQRDYCSDPHRKRSSSATEMNRPTALLQRRQTHGGGGGKPLLVNPYSGYSSAMPVYLGPIVAISSPSPPEVNLDNVAPVSSSLPRVPQLAVTRSASHRRHSVSAVSSAGAGACAGAALVDVADRPVISHERTKSCPVSDSSSLPLIVEPHRVMSQWLVSAPENDGRCSGGGSGTIRRPLPGKSSSGTRERCDSLPSRNRTTSEGTHKFAMMSRPASVHMRGVSYSPPGPCSTDSAGSSLSIDDVDVDRLPHAVTPDEHTIPEENTDDTLQWPQDEDLESEKLDTYLSMTRPPESLSLPIYQGRKISAPGALHGSPCGSSPSNTSDYLLMSPSEAMRRARPGSSPSFTSDYLPMSPGDSSCRRRDIANASDYLPLSPVGLNRRIIPPNSPSNHSDYLPMSPAEGPHRGAHSRESSLAEDGYVPMAPAHSDDGYVDMDPVTSQHFMHDDHHSDISHSSSCSVTSGTPLSDHYLLEKVPAYFTPSEEEEGSTGGPTRTYSFGSQPKGRLDLLNAAEVARVRAFSMGNQQRPNTHKLSMRPVTTAKFPSAPLLSSSWSGSSRNPQSDAMSHLMEIDYTKKPRSGSRYKNLPVVENLMAQNNSSADSGYMDMSSKSPPRASPPKNLLTKLLFSPPDGKSLGSRKPAVISSSTLKTIGERPDIKPQLFPTTSSANISIFPNKHAVEKPYMEMKGRTLSGSSEGYMEMGASTNSSKMSRKTSVDSDYLAMHGGKRASDASMDYLPMSCGKRSSQPIAIVSPISPPIRKSSSTTPPKPPNCLAIDGSTGSLNSMRRNPKRKGRKKAEKRGSKENITTPTAIFSLSLNSPQSPKKVYSTGETSATAALPEPTESDSLVAPLSRVLRICSKDNSAATAATSEAQESDDGDYALMRPGVPITQKWTPPSKFCEDSRKNANKPPSSPRPSDQISDTDVLGRLASEESRSKTSDRMCEPCRLHSGVTRQVSTSSSSSTEVISVKDITYASLDLGSEGEEPRSPRPSPAPSPAPSGPFSYAEIDFQKSESLRTPSQSYNRKIPH